MAYDRSVAVREEVSDNPATPQAALAYLADDSNEVVRYNIARRIDDPSILAKLADDEEAFVRSDVAERTNDPEILAKLSDDEKGYIRETVAERTDDPAILEKLSDDEYASVRRVVAKRTTDPAVLTKLANDKFWDVRIEVAGRTNDTAILEKLAKDNNSRVQEVAISRISDPEILAKLANKEARAPKKSKPSKPTQTEWSVPIYELQNYSDIEGEIDQVISAAVASAMATAYPGEEFSFETTANSYDEDGQLVIQVAGQTLTYDLQTLLPMATFSQKKKDCIKKVADYIIKNA